MQSDIAIPLERVGAFIRQHTHNLQNGLNGLDFESTLLREIVTDPAGRESVERMRRQIRDLAEQLRMLSAQFQERRPHRAPIAARELMLIWRDAAKNLPAPLEVKWQDELAEECVTVDIELIADILRELLVNAAKFRPASPVTASARISGDQVIFELQEPKSAELDVTAWGETPFHSVSRAGFGLGLWVAARNAEASLAQLTRVASSDQLTSRLALATT